MYIHIIQVDVVNFNTSRLVFFVFPCQTNSTRPDEKQKQNPRVTVTILIANDDNPTMKHGGPTAWRLLRCFWITVPSVSHSPMTDSTDAVTLACSSVTE